MKKITLLSAVVVAAVAMTSCGTSKESAYRKAYEKAKAQEQVIEQQPQVQPQQEVAVVTPLVEKPAVPATNVDDVAVRQENLTVVNGSGMKSYSVVVGAYSIKANAQGEQTRLKNAGFDAQLAYNSERNMYRVIIATYDNKVDAVRKRDEVRNSHPDAWLLYNNK